MANFTLFTWGTIVFQVYPLNINEWHHVTATDWARKEIAGAATYREWVGENDEEIHLRGKCFPRFYAQAAQRRGNADIARFSPPGGVGHLDMIDNMRRLGQAHALVRGDGWHFGWFVIERLERGHTWLGPDGVGQQIDFDATFQRVPVPTDPALYARSLWAR